jgi:predicted histidine transporter YuiF (NhaC family)
MVCPYRATTGFITAVLSIFYLHSTYADVGMNKKLVDNEDHKKTPMARARRMALIAVLVLFHVDLFTTGYLRSGVKAGISIIQQASVQA